MSAPVRPLGRLGRLLGLAATAALLATLIPLSGVAAAADHFLVTASFAGSNYLSGAPLTVTVTAKNSDGTTDTGYAGTVHFTSSDGAAVLPGDYTYVSGDQGSRTFQVTLATAGSQTVTATDTSTSSIVGSVTVAVKLQLKFTQDPGGGTGGVAWTQQPIVQLQNYTGAAVANALGGSAPVVLSIYTNPAGGTLSGCSATPTNGIASFSGCKIDKAGTGYALVAAAANSISATSGAFTIIAGPAAGLKFTLYPPSITTANLGTITVSIVDAGGNPASPVPSATQITLGVASGPGTITCTGSGTSVFSVNGVATFPGCIASVVSSTTPYSLTASAPTTTWSPAVPVSFTVTSGPASKLALCWGPLTSGCNTTPPTNITGGTPFPVQPTIVLQDANGNTVTADNTTTVALSITPGTPYATSAGTLTCLGGLSMRVTAGVASFSGCAIDKAASGYRLTANSYPIYTPATSNTFNVSVGPPTQLVFTAQPTAATANQPFPIQPVVAIADAGGNTVPSTSATITLSILNNPAGGTLTCTGGLSKTTYLGVATFGGCSINNAGAGYTLSAVATNVTPYVYLASIATNLFNVIAPVAQITLTPSASVITWAQPVTITAQFALNGAGKTFALQTSTDAVNWVTTTTLTADSSGQASFTWTPVTNLWYRAVFAGTPDLSAGTSNQFRVVVRQIALLRPTNSGKVKTIAGGTEVTFTTTVRPARPELVRAKVTFTFTLYQHGRLIYSGKRDVYIDSAGLARWTWKFGTWGDWYVRAVANPTPANANSYWSPIERYYVY